jgi:hypothetical protein
MALNLLSRLRPAKHNRRNQLAKPQWNLEQLEERQLLASIWSDTTTPTVITDPDPTAVELGVKFRASQTGTITGIRFYKGPQNTGTHVGHLWSSSGTLLATATFTGETATGWQQVNLASAVAITANTTYVASYHTSSGFYSADPSYFATSGVTNGPLRALANGEDGPNGVYRYGSSGFPNETYLASNYWVDVVFSATGGPDTTPPTIASTAPPTNGTGVNTLNNVVAVFNEPMDPTTISTNTFQLRDPANNVLAATVSYDAGTATATLDPTATLAYSTTYTAVVKGGGVDPRVKDLAGNALAADYTWSFTTAAAPSASNPIVAENLLPGNPASEWDVSGSGDSSIQGYATDISVDRGQTVSFKINTTASAYYIDIYRLGYYGGLGARKVASVLPSASLPQNQPACLSDSATGLVDCGNWATSASWFVPSDAVSGVYIAKAIRPDTGGASHIVFIVRDDNGQSDLLFQTADTTWQAYNRYGGNSLYVGSPAGRAYKVSYNRPFTTRAYAAEDWLFNAEYPMIRWIEANGYNVSYTTGVDSDRLGGELLEHRAFLSVGHDEYWSNGQRTNVEAARAAGVNLAFFSGNEVFWKTRWENSISSSATPYRTLVSYKETHANAKIDPLPNVWTGTWRDPRFSPPADGGRPENALTGTLFMVNDGATTAISVPEADGKMRLWRNTSVATQSPGQVATLSANTLGYEWDIDVDNGSRPAGLIQLSTTTVNNAPVLLDYGSTYGSGTATHSLTLYRHTSGSLVFGAGTVQWSWGLDGNHDRGGSTPDVRMQQATVNLFADMTAQPGSLQAGLVAATTSTDTIAPTSIITSPTAGANLSSGVPVTISGTASDAGGGVVGGVEVSVDGGVTWRRANGRASWSYSWTPTGNFSTTIKSRAADDSGRLETPGAGVAVTVGNPPSSGGSYTIWNPTATPAVVTANDANAIELGVRFRTTETGTITGIRFYKGAQNTGTHVGSLWTTGGSLLASATFTGETASGWQQVTLASPVSIAANTTYVASYHTDVGFYSVDQSYFATSGVTNGPIRALADGEDGPNGVYKYGALGFPNQTYLASNYWVDVVFTVPGADTTAPTVIAKSPTAGATGVSTGTNVTVTFSEAMNATTINTNTIELRDPSNSLVTATVSYDSATYTATLDPTGLLANGATYTAIVKGGGVDPRVKDVAGNALAANHTWTFTTTAAPPNEGPGGPILVVASTANPFTRYYAEILRTEGLNEFTVSDISLVSAATLNAYDVVILGEMPLSSAQVSMFTNWVTGGGNLIAMRPDKQLASLLGIADAAATRSNAYMLVNTASSPGAGIVGESIQYHGAADLYTLAGATSVAAIYSNATTATANPAVTLRSVGSAGGQAAAFTYDLARSVVYTRQGNPAWSGQDRDGFAPIRSNDLFFGAASFDPQPDWIDLNKVAIPQADEQQRLLANMIHQMNLDKKPLPRFWYFPRGGKAVVLMTGDDHGNGGTAGRFDQFLAASPPGSSVADWTAIRGTSYIYPNTPISNTQLAAYSAQGFEVSLHVNTNCADWTAATLESFFATQLGAWQSAYPSLPAPTTHRTHCIAWSDYTTQPQVELNHGIRLDTNYYYWPPAWVANRPGMFTGSGMLMRFATAAGDMIDVYQAPTEMTDESGQSYPATVDALLDGALGAQGYYGAFTVNAHTDQVNSAIADAVIGSALARGVPVITARQMLDWLDGRNASSFGSMIWNAANRTLSFSITAGATATGLQAMVPAQSATGPLASVTRGGTPVAFTTQTIKGVSYAFFNATAGSYVAQYLGDTTAPTIQGRSPAPGASGVDANSNVTVTFSEPMNPATITTATFRLRASGAASDVPATVTYSGTTAVLDPTATLAAGTTYQVTVDGSVADTGGNTLGANDTWSFATAVVTSTIGDSTSAHFGAGTPGANTYVSITADGEVILTPAVGAEFSGAALPGDWSTTLWSSSGSAVVSGGKLTVNGARTGTTAVYGPGRSVEFVATFSGDANQHVGFGIDFIARPWAIFSTRNGGTLQARTQPVSGSASNTTIAGNWLGAPHRFRIDWTSTNVTYWIDGVQVASHARAITTNMRPLASDYSASGGNVSVDWLRMTPYAASGSFTSRVLDAGSAVNWQTASWTSQLAAGTGLVINVRTGNTPTPDASWTSFTALSGSGATIGATARYLQYRADLTTSNTGQTPVLQDVTFVYSGGGVVASQTASRTVAASSSPEQLPDSSTVATVVSIVSGKKRKGKRSRR